ncbi:LYR motif-containing protein bcn92 [Calliopsis andreniformis]|uniref:LYR motif-containing protein bcn92 n=1 Tax=Calliopsis andreniformis TaxID=337506 RepID=UPI003FCE3E16
MATSRNAILCLYRNLIRESNRWNTYNYRMYALRKIRSEFRENQTLRDKEKIAKCYKKGLETLDMLQRQVVIGNMYCTRPLIIETVRNKDT